MKISFIQNNGQLDLLFQFGWTSIEVWILKCWHVLQDVEEGEAGVEEDSGAVAVEECDTVVEDEEGGGECVICMSEPRDTLILPCRHLCLCQLCADSLRYQANNCPICRAPFRALLQIRALRKLQAPPAEVTNRARFHQLQSSQLDQIFPNFFMPV